MIMKILFVASNPDAAVSLDLEREITHLQQRLSLILPSHAPLELRFLPHLEVDQLLDELRERPPDVLHLSAHGAPDGTQLSDSGQDLWVTDQQVVKLLKALPQRPRLVCLNACNSALVASALTDEAVDYAVGTTIPLPNRSAIRSVSTLYEWLARGHTLRAAFDAAGAVLDALERQPNTLSLYNRKGANPAYTRLRAVPMIVAGFRRSSSGARKGKLRTERTQLGNYSLEVGLVDCPADTVQVVFFVDDPSFVGNDETRLAEDLCTVARKQPLSPEFWLDDQWDAAADYHMFATVVRADGTAFTLRSSPSEALTAGLDRDVDPELSAPERKRVARVAGELRGSPP
jgi:hypothetical protein